MAGSRVWSYKSNSNVDSTCLTVVAYDEPNSTLDLTFAKEGAIYRYNGVDYRMYRRLMTAWSKGKFFNNYIRNANYSYTKLG
jgi:hypothetical protein